MWIFSNVDILSIGSHENVDIFIGGYFKIIWDNMSFNGPFNS